MLTCKNIFLFKDSSRSLVSSSNKSFFTHRLWTFEVLDRSGLWFWLDDLHIPLYLPSKASTMYRDVNSTRWLVARLVESYPAWLAARDEPHFLAKAQARAGPCVKFLTNGTKLLTTKYTSNLSKPTTYFCYLAFLNSFLLYYFIFINPIFRYSRGRWIYLFIFLLEINYFFKNLVFNRTCG